MEFNIDGGKGWDLTQHPKQCKRTWDLTQPKTVQKNMGFKPNVDSSRQFGYPSKLPNYYGAATDSKIYFATVSAANALCIESSR